MGIADDEGAPILVQDVTPFEAGRCIEVDGLSWVTWRGDAEPLGEFCPVVLVVSTDDPAVIG